MTFIEDLLYTLNWLLDTAQSDPSGLNPIEWRLPWQLDVRNSQDFGADLKAGSQEFIISVSNSVWPRLEAFCAYGIDWEAKARKPRRKVFNYSPTDWQTIILLTQDDREWSSIEDAATKPRENSHSNKRVLIPLSVHAANGVLVHTAAAYYGFFWLICHEATHAWKRHYKLLDMAFRESIRHSSPLLAGAELHRTCESDADWESVKLLFAHTLNCVLGGYSTDSAYAAGFGTSAALLMLNPSRHNVWEQAEDYDPAWMRLHFVQDAAKAGCWWIQESRYPEYTALVSKYGVNSGWRGSSSMVEPSLHFSKKSTETFEAFWLGQVDAMRFARAISDANELHHIVGSELFKFGEPDDWKEFQIMVMETDVVNRRRMARKELNRHLPADPKFQGFAMGHGAYVKLSFLAGLRRRSRVPVQTDTE